MSEAETDVFMVSVELSVASKPLEKKGAMGGFVSCLVPASCIRDAIDIAESSLKEEGYLIKRIEKAELIDDSEWQENQEILELTRQVRSDQEIAYTTFHIYEHEYEH